MFKEFKKFILRGNVVDLAVGIVIGAAFTGVVQALVKDFITPLIGLFGGNRDLFVVLPVNKLMDKYHPAPQPAPTKECPECTSKIPKVARRCPQCTAQLEAP